jgi:hypothetical protein
VTLDKGQSKKGVTMFEVLVSELLKEFSGVMLLWGDCDADLQNSMIDKTVVLEVGADICLPKPLEIVEFVIAVSERPSWIELCVPA